MRKGVVFLICFSFLAFLVSCGGSGDGPSNAAPVVNITSPAGTTFIYSDNIAFAGTGTDAEDGPVTGGALVWTSDMAGQIGTGVSFSLDALAVGDHLITLTGTDSNGAEGTDTLTIAITSPLPDTGQTTFYTTGTYGEDADYLINEPSYAKLDAAGNDLPAGAPTWTMVRDDVTGLIWEAKTDDGTIHDKDMTFSWQFGQDMFIAPLNNDNFGGHADWRLPTIKELSTLVHADLIGPAINMGYFPQTMPSAYWSSTTYVGITDNAWYVDFSNGEVEFIHKTRVYYVRAVRGGQ